MHCGVVLSAVHCGALRCIEVRCSVWGIVVRCGALRCIVVWCCAVHCGAVRCAAVHCGAVLCGALWCSALRCIVVRQCAAVHCGEVRCCAVRCIGVVRSAAVQCGAVRCRCSAGTNGKSTADTPVTMAPTPPPVTSPVLTLAAEASPRPALGAAESCCLPFRLAARNYTAIYRHTGTGQPTLPAVPAGEVTQAVMHGTDDGAKHSASTVRPLPYRTHGHMPCLTGWPVGAHRHTAQASIHGCKSNQSIHSSVSSTDTAARTGRRPLYP